MNQYMQLYQLLRTPASIYLARIEKVDVSAGQPGQQKISLQILIERTLWGQMGTPRRYFDFTQPESKTAQVKFPHPVWRHVTISEGALVFLVTRELSESPADPLYVEEIADQNDPVLSAVLAVLEEEQKGDDANGRLNRYLNYLNNGPTVQKLFGAEALAKDSDLPQVDRQGQVANAMANVFASDETAFVRISVGGWMWQDIYSRSNADGRVAIINVTLRGLHDASEDIRRSSADYLTRLHASDLKQAGVIASPEAIGLLAERKAQETAAEVQDHIQNLIDALK